MVLSIRNAEYIEEYKIKFVFSDRVEQAIDFAPFLHDTKNPMAKKHLDKQLFQNFTIEYGDIIWNDYEMCLPIWDLHQGTI